MIVQPQSAQYQFWQMFSLIFIFKHETNNLFLMSETIYKQLIEKHNINNILQ